MEGRWCVATGTCFQNSSPRPALVVRELKPASRNPNSKKNQQHIDDVFTERSFAREKVEQLVLTDDPSEAHVLSPSVCLDDHMSKKREAEPMEESATAKQRLARNLAPSPQLADNTRTS